MSFKKLYIETHGCQMNVDDSLRMAHLLKPQGYQITAEPRSADLILINTCSVREKASHKAHSAVGRFHAYKQIKPELILGIAGCQAQAEGQKLLNRFHYLDFVLGPDQLANLPTMIEELEKHRSGSINATARIKPLDFEFASLAQDVSESKVSAFVTIMKGCDNFCSFCIVPYVRGREVSRPANEILDEILRLTDQGVKEVTLLGQNVNSYGTKTQGGPSFTDLIYEIAAKTPIKRLRFTTSHPKDVGPDLMQAFRDLPILAKHFHLPVQSGSNAVLKRMHRTYTREEYLAIVDGLRASCPEIAFGTDLIVGFPGETDQNFNETLSLLDAVRFDSAYSFCYSPRPYTTAGRYFEDDVPFKVKEERLKILQKKQADIIRQKNEACIGEIAEVLIEGPSKISSGFQGRTSQNRIVHLEEIDESAVGEIFEVKIKRATANALIGETRKATLPSATDENRFIKGVPS